MNFQDTLSRLASPWVGRGRLNIGPVSLDWSDELDTILEFPGHKFVASGPWTKVQDTNEDWRFHLGGLLIRGWRLRKRA